MNKHPNLQLVDVVCSTCGTTHTVRTSVDRLTIDTCSSCHPAYTGVERATTTGSRIERFNRRYFGASAAA